MREGYSMANLPQYSVGWEIRTKHVMTFTDYETEMFSLTCLNCGKEVICDEEYNPRNFIPMKKGVAKGNVPWKPLGSHYMRKGNTSQFGGPPSRITSHV